MRLKILHQKKSKIVDKVKKWTYHGAMKIQNCNHFQKISVAISPEERVHAKEIAKSKGMTFQGWLGQLVKRELELESRKIEADDGGAATSSHPLNLGPSRQRPSCRSQRSEGSA